MRYLIKIQYDGSKFSGFQRQKNKKTIQGELENALSIINKNPVNIKGAGRTDIGVHAYGQCAHFDLSYDIPEDRLMTAINSIVHPYINIVYCKKVSESFHARFSVKEKEYVYKIWTSKYDPLLSDYYLIYDKNINIKKLRECAKMFLGVHDFHNFVSGERVNNVASIKSIKIKKEKDFIRISFTGKSFYRYMVRNLVGAMLDYNEEKCELMLINKMLNEKEYKHQLRTALANGLYLNEVKYE